jgi:tetratricopeptide (TPR) repeat protein
VARGVKAVPDSGPLRNSYAYAFLSLGRYPEAIRELEAYARLNPKEPNPYDSLGEAYLVSGQPQKALETYARALEVDSSFTSSFRGRAWAYGMLGRFDEALAELQRRREVETRSALPTTDTLTTTAFLLSQVGRYREAEKQLREGERLAERFQDALNVSRIHRLAALLALERQDSSLALQELSRARQASQSIPSARTRTDVELAVQLLTGVAHIQAGRLDAAREQLEQQRKILEGAGETPGIYDRRNPSHNWYFRCLEGEIALAAGDLATAEAAFAAGEPEFKPPLSGPTASPVFFNNLPFRDGSARVRAARGDLKGAIEAYRRLLTPDISQKWTATVEPRFVLELARLLERAGDRAAAREQYQRFLDLWKRADPERPELDEARRRLKQL